jgi:hypothetical protein
MTANETAAAMQMCNGVSNMGKISGGLGWCCQVTCKKSLHTHARMYHAPLLVTRQWISLSYEGHMTIILLYFAFLKLFVSENKDFQILRFFHRVAITGL